jgi:cytochrome P450
MPYTEATIMETLRFSSLIPTGVWHSTLRDVEFHGFLIPKDTMIIPNLYAVHHDARIWGEDVETFNPERFLSPEGRGVVRPEAFIPFSTGRRLCIGENLAKDELFLIIAAIFQTFHVETDPSEPPPSLEPVPGPVSSPKPHQLIFRLRQP